MILSWRILGNFIFKRADKEWHQNPVSPVSLRSQIRMLEQIHFPGLFHSYPLRKNILGKSLKIGKLIRKHLIFNMNLKAESHAIGMCSTNITSIIFSKAGNSPVPKPIYLWIYLGQALYSQISSDLGSLDIYSLRCPSFVIYQLFCC